MELVKRVARERKGVGFMLKNNNTKTSRKMWYTGIHLLLQESFKCWGVLNLFICQLMGTQVDENI